MQKNEIFIQVNKEIAEIRKQSYTNLCTIIEIYIEKYWEKYKEDPENAGYKFCYNFWCGLKSVNTRNNSQLSEQTIKAICNMYCLFFDIFTLHNMYINLLDIRTVEKNNKEYSEWFRLYTKEVMEQLSELFISLNLKDTYSLDSVVRGLRVIEENIYFWLLIMECENKMWDPEPLTWIIDKKRNDARIETFSDNDIYIKDRNHFLNGLEYTTDKYIVELQRQNEEYNEKYMSFIKKEKRRAEKKIKRELNLGKKNIDKLKSLKNNKQKFKQELEKMLSSELLSGAELTECKNGEKIKSKLSEKETIDLLFERLKFLNYTFELPKDIYKHINNVFILNMIVHDKNIIKISGFHGYMKQYTLTGAVTKSASVSEFNMSNHAMIESIHLNETVILLNKVEPIVQFLESFKMNHQDYIQLIYRKFFTAQDIRKAMDKFK